VAGPGRVRLPGPPRTRLRRRSLHTQRALAALIREALGARYVFTVKGNQAGLHAALAGLCWAGARRHATADKGHGRREARSHLVMDAPEEIKALFGSWCRVDLYVFAVTLSLTAWMAFLDGLV
jgi:hypothetical protein